MQYQQKGKDFGFNNNKRNLEISPTESEQSARGPNNDHSISRIESVQENNNDVDLLISDI